MWPRIHRSDTGHKSSSAIGACDSDAAKTSMAGTLSPSTSTPIAYDHHPSTRSRSSMGAGNSSSKGLDDVHASSSRGKGKAVLKCLADESRGLQTRNAACKKGTSNRDSQLNQSQGNSGSEVCLLRGIY